MSKPNRQKASDVLRESNYVFSSKVNFSTAFPEINHVKIIVLEAEAIGKIDFDNPPDSTCRMCYDESTAGEYIDCRNSRCYNGGFSIGSILREMVYNKEITKEDNAPCQGYEGSPKGRRRYRSCLHRFYYRVTIEYKQ